MRHRQILHAARFWQGSLRIITEFCQHQPELFRRDSLRRGSRKKQRDSCEKDHETDEHFFQRTINVNCTLWSGYSSPHILTNKWLGAHSEEPRFKGFELTTRCLAFSHPDHAGERLDLSR